MLQWTRLLFKSIAFFIFFSIIINYSYYFGVLPMARKQTGDENFDVFKSVTGLIVCRIMDFLKTQVYIIL